MSEEEKEAIENIKALKILFEIDDKKDFEATPLVQKEMAKDLRTLLNLIEKLSKENEQLRTEMNSLQKELKKKDKIIEQMTYYIMNLDIDEDICKKVNCDTNSGELDCKDCIKQYFENKVKEIK